MGPPSGIRRAGHRHCGPHRDVVGIHALGPGRRVDHLARLRSHHADGVLLVSARTSKATTRVLVGAIHAHPRHCPRPIVGPAVLTAPPFAPASAPNTRTRSVAHASVRELPRANPAGSRLSHREHLPKSRSGHDYETSPNTIGPVVVCVEVTTASDAALTFHASSTVP